MQRIPAELAEIRRRSSHRQWAAASLRGIPERNLYSKLSDYGLDQ